MAVANDDTGIIVLDVMTNIDVTIGGCYRESLP